MTRFSKQLQELGASPEQVTSAQATVDYLKEAHYQNLAEVISGMNHLESAQRLLSLSIKAFDNLDEKPGDFIETLGEMADRLGEMLGAFIAGGLSSLVSGSARKLETDGVLRSGHVDSPLGDAETVGPVSDSKVSLEEGSAAEDSPRRATSTPEFEPLCSAVDALDVALRRWNGE